MVKVRLDTTEGHDGRFTQQWSIIDQDDTHDVVSESEWGDVSITKGGDRVYNIDGVAVRADQIIAVEISCLCNCTEEGDETIVDSKWIERAEESGISPCYLGQPA